MKTVFEIVKIVLLALIVLLLGVDAGLVDQSSWARVTGWFERAGIIAVAPGDGEPVQPSPAAAAELADQSNSRLIRATTVAESAPEGDAHSVPLNAELGSVQAAQSEGAQPGSADAVLVDTGADEVAENDAPWAAMEVGSEHELKTLLQHRLASRYEFPEHVRFRNTRFTVQRLFHDAGLEVSEDREVEFAIYCGEYSVPNSAALYGVYRPFYAEVLVSHADRSIDGEYWLDINGDIKKSISFRSDLLISGRQETFDRLYSQHCGSKKGFLLGDYRDYAVGQLAPFYRRHFSEITDKASHPEYARNLMECIQSKVTLQECYRKLPASTGGQ